MKQKKIDRSICFPREKKELENFLIFLRLLLFLISNFWCFAQTGTQKNAIPIKKKDKQMQPHHPQSRGNGTTISAKLVYALLCYSWFYLWSQSQDCHALPVSNALNFKKSWELK